MHLLRLQITAYYSYQFKNYIWNKIHIYNLICEKHGGEQH